MMKKAPCGTWFAFLFLLAAVLLSGCGDSGEEAAPVRQSDDDSPYVPDDDGDDDSSSTDDDDDDDTSPTTDDDDDDTSPTDDDDDNNDDNDNDDNDNDTTPEEPIPDEWIVDDADGYTDLVLDASADPHIVYYEQTTGLKYAAWSGSAWTIETVDDSDSEVGFYAAIALDPTTGMCLTAYQNSDALTLKFAGQTAKGWDVQLVDDSAEVGAWCDILADDTGQVFISYYDATNGALKLATEVGKAWQSEVVEDGENLGLYTSLAIDSAEQLHIAYYDAINKCLKHASGVPGAWSIEVVEAPAGEENDIGRWTSLTIDAADDLHLAYQDAGLLDLKYAKLSNGVWTTTTIDGVGNKGADACLMIDPTFALPRIVYQDGSGLSIKYAEWDGSAWDKETLLDGTVYEGSFGFWMGCGWRTAGPVVSHYYSYQQDDYLLIYPVFE